jgi:hypothetical protein
MDYYRDIYAEAMADCGCPDAHPTFDSAMYAGAMGAVLGVCGGGDVIDFTEKLLRSMLSPFLHRVDHVEFLVALGHDWPYAEAMLKQELDVFIGADYLLQDSFSCCLSINDRSLKRPILL